MKWNDIRAFAATVLVGLLAFVLFLSPIFLIGLVFGGNAAATALFLAIIAVGSIGILWIVGSTILDIREDRARKRRGGWW